MRIMVVLVLVVALAGCSTRPATRLKREWAGVYEDEKTLLKFYQLAQVVVLGRRVIKDGEHFVVVEEVWKADPQGPRVGELVRIGSELSELGGNPDPLEVCFLRGQHGSDRYASMQVRLLQAGRVRSHPEFTVKKLRRYFARHGDREELLPAEIMVKYTAPIPPGLSAKPGDVFAVAQATIGADGSVTALETVNSWDERWSQRANAEILRYRFRPANLGAQALESRVRLVFLVTDSGQRAALDRCEHIEVLPGPR